MSLTTSIPRFLLPQRGSIWRARHATPSTSLIAVRHASKIKPKQTKLPDPNKPIVLEKPAKFNPPSHGSRRPKPAPRYPGPNLSTEEKQIQKTKKYPNMMPPEGSFLHWFLNNRSIHSYITLGTLFVLAATVFITDFKNNSPFADMIPHWTQMFLHPIAYGQTWVEVWRLNTAKTTAETQERRQRKVEDVQKRAAYRKAHGLDKDEGFGGWTAKKDDETMGPGLPIADLQEQVEIEPTVVEAERKQKRPVKKWLGIW